MKPARGNPSILTPSQTVRLAQKILREKYPGADCAFVAGSLIRGEGTPTSDIDLVVVFERLKNAYRESYIYGDTPIEAFIHDPETINHFFVADIKDRHVSLIHMIASGTVIPKTTKISHKIEKLASQLIKQGPPKISSREIDILRYGITDMTDDLRGGLNPDEQIATAVILFERMSRALQIQSGQWLGTGKYAARNTKQAKPDFIPKYRKALMQLMRTGETRTLIKLTDEILQPWHGHLFDGYINHAPKNFRLKKIKQ